MMFFFRKVLPILPVLPSLIVFGCGMVLLYFAKKKSSMCLKVGGFVMSIGAGLIIIMLVVLAVMSHRHTMEMGTHDGMGPMGGRCPMMEMMKDGGMPEGPQPPCNCPGKCGMMGGQQNPPQTPPVPAQAPRMMHRSK
ncbi:MAG: hypothetical protein WCQ53_05165 [bacterium]